MTPNSRRLFFAVLLTAAAAAAFANEGTPLQRYGIIVGINEGGPKRSPLRFAATDAQAFASVMQEMGGLPASNRTMLLNPMQDDILQAFTEMGRKIEAAKQTAKRREFIFYYSGHSDEEGLLIGDQRLGYKELRVLISAIPAEVRIAVIDACASGAFVRLKGGVQKPPFMSDAAVEMKGYAFLTSSSETEAAQESDNIEASFFTHYLVSGLRGAADATKDGVVTLNEAYHFAFNETLVRTEKTQYGPQHPSYDIQLNGTGDLVLTDLRETSAGLIIEDKIEGRIYVRDGRSKLVVELNKQEKSPLEIGLAEGLYTVLVDANGALRRADIRLVNGRRVTLRDADLVSVRPELTQRRGEDGEEPDEGLDGAEPPEEEAAAEVESPLPAVEEVVRQTRSFFVTIFPTRVARPHSNIEVTNHAVFNLTVGLAQNVRGVDLSLLGSVILSDLSGVQFSTLFNITRGRANFWQGACLFNIAGGSLGGLQTSALFNYAGGDSKGVQLGLVNVAKNFGGVQIGLVNICDDNSGFAIGLVNYERKGIHEFELWHDSGNFTNTAFKMGTKISYGILTAGYDFVDPESWYRFGAGFGFRIPFGIFFVDIDTYLSSLCRTADDRFAIPFERTLLPQLRLKTGLELFGWLGLFAGVDVQAFIPGLLYEPALMQDAVVRIPTQGSADTINIVPRFFFGIHLF